MSSQNLQLKIKTENTSDKILLEQIAFQKMHSVESSITPEIDTIILQFQKKGYLNVSLDSLYKRDSIYFAEFILGKQVQKIKIFYGNDSLHEVLLTKKILTPIAPVVTDTYFEISFEEISHTLDYLLAEFEKKGNSFTQIRLKNIQIEENTARADLYISQTNVRTIDKVIIKGYEKFPKNFIPFDLNLKLKSTFNQIKLKNASEALRGLSFAEELKSPEVLFTKDSTIIYLYLKKKNANKFDGIIGFSSKEDSNGLEFNGYLDLLFNNIFNTGESIAIFWKNNGNDSQRFYFSAETPYLFNIPVIPKATFEIFRQDTTFNTITVNLNLSYLINNKNKFNLAFSSETSNNLLQNNSAITSLQNYSNTFYGLGYNFRQLNSDLLFHEKFIFNFYSFLGNRKTDLQNTSQSKFNLKTSYLWSLNFKNHIFIQNQSAIINSDDYLNNELFRIGGINTIRGFNEESIFTSAYSIMNFEYRFKPNISSYLYSIMDFAYLENQNLKTNAKIYSLGLGYSFLTKMGMLNLSYAVGKFEDKPFIFNESKIHIKIISFF